MAVTKNSFFFIRAFVISISISESSQILRFATYDRVYGELKLSVNTKVDMRFNVKTAYWLGDRIRERIMQLVCISGI